MKHDSRASSFLYNYLQNKITFTEETSAEYRFELSWFIVNLFWRIPNSNKRFEELMLKHGISNKYFQIINKQTKNLTSQDIVEKFQSYIW